MHIAILHQAVTPGASADELDVLVQVEAVAAAVEGLGHRFDVIACDLDLQRLAGRLSAPAPDRVFNLVESLNGTDALQFVPPALLESLGLPFTGSSSEAIFATIRKTFAKQQLRLRGLPTPAWQGPVSASGATSGFEPGRYILKPILEHASVGMTDADVGDYRTPVQLLQAVAAKSSQMGRPCFAERYIEGREFNLALLANPNGVQVLPPAEIRFENYPPGKPRIVGSAAKWDPESFEYASTPRRFDFDASDDRLLDLLRALATKCWLDFGLRGYARVDFRVDESGRPWILEINPNPCLSPDAGFFAAADQAGLSFEDVVSRILNAV